MVAEVEDLHCGYGPGPDFELVAGIDEVGRGPLAGPVVAAAVILDARNPVAGLSDSKKLSEKKREYLAELIKKQSISWSIARAEVSEIDSLNILQASLLAMKRALDGLQITADYSLIDGNRIPDGLYCPATAIVKGDDKVPVISAAAILAKVARDQEMIEMDAIYPGYGLAKHKGYPTRLHMEMLERYGVTEIHRRSFRPVRNIIERKR